MGNQQSTASNISTIVNKSLNSALVSNSTNCGMNNSAIQEFSLTNVDAGNCNLEIKSDQVASQTPNFSCYNETAQSSKVMADFTDALNQNAKSELAGIPGAINSVSMSEIVSNTINDIKNSITISNVSNCVQNNFASQESMMDSIKGSCPAVCGQELPANVDPVIWGNMLDKSCKITINNSQDLTQAAVSKCTAQNTQLQDVINKASTEITQQASSENTGFLNITDIFGNLSTSYIASIIGLVICCLAIVISSAAFVLSPAGQSASSTFADTASSAASKYI